MKTMLIADGGLRKVEQSPELRTQNEVPPEEKSQAVMVRVADLISLGGAPLATKSLPRGVEPRNPTMPTPQPTLSPAKTEANDITPPGAPRGVTSTDANRPSDTTTPRGKLDVLSDGCSCFQNGAAAGFSNGGQDGQPAHKIPLSLQADESSVSLMQRKKAVDAGKSGVKMADSVHPALSTLRSASAGRTGRQRFWRWAAYVLPVGAEP